MSARLPLSTLPLSQYLPVSSTTASPSKTKHLTPLRQSPHAMSLLPSPFLPSTTPRTVNPSGPLATLYERAATASGGSPRSRTRSRTPSSRLVDQEEQLELLEGDETIQSTTPKRLLDLFVQSTEKDTRSPSRASDRVSSAHKGESEQETASTWNFYFDDASEPCVVDTNHDSASAQAPVVVEDESEDDPPASPPFKENVRLPPRRLRSATSTSLLSVAQADIAPTPASLPGSTNSSPTRATQAPSLSAPPPSNAVDTLNSNPPSRPETPPRTPEAVLHSPTYPSNPSLVTGRDAELGEATVFSDGGIGSFERGVSEQSLSGLGLRMEADGIGNSTARKTRGKKRISDEKVATNHEERKDLSKRQKTSGDDE